MSRSDEKCSGCAAPLDPKDGVEIWGLRFCSTCFIGNAAGLHRELTASDIELLRTIGRELSGYLPPDVLRMVVTGFWRRSTGRNDDPPAEEMARFVGEIQRLAAFANLRKVMNLLQTWQSTFNEFVDQQMGEIRETIKRLTEP